MTVYVAPVTQELVGVAEIAEMLGVTRQRVHQLTKAPEFPRPVAELSAGSIWAREDVERWARASGRLS
jgi:predicted DNA-binding transcriptional regulator AlpA